MAEIIHALEQLDWSPLYISLKTGVIATFVSFFLGIFAAGKAVKASPVAGAVLDGILTLPIVLPPTVAGFFLLLVFSTRRPAGAFLYDTFHIRVIQTQAGCVIAAVVIAFPLMYRNARAAFEQVDVNLIYAAQTLGMPEWKIFWNVVMPSAGPGVAAGTVLAKDKKGSWEFRAGCGICQRKPAHRDTGRLRKRQEPDIKMYCRN